MGGLVVKIKIAIYKQSGKFYTDDVVESKKDIPMWEEGFKEFIRNNLPVNIGEGYIIVEDAEDNTSFHNALYRFEDLFEESIQCER